MTDSTNPFDILPENLFNILGTQGQSGWQRHYMAILLRIYHMAEFNRFGLTREQVVGEIVAYLKQQEVDSLPLADEVRPGDLPEYASFIVRRLADAGWIEREQQADYTEMIILPDYAFTLLEAFETIQQQKPREYTGQLYAAHQLVTQQGEDFAPALALTQAYENVRQVVRGLNELNQNIRRYTERATRNRPVAELLRLQYDEYAQVLGPTYHALKTSDHVSRYRRDIIGQLQQWQLDESWLEQTANELATQGQATPATASQEISRYLGFIINQLETLDPLLAEIDRRHTQYLRTSLRQVQYQLVSADGSFKERLVSLGRELARLLELDESWLPDESPAFQAMPLAEPDQNSFYTPPMRRTPFTPKPVVVPVLDPATIQNFRSETLRDMGRMITPAKIQQFVDQFFNGADTLHIGQFPPGVFAQESDLPWLIYTIAYGNHPQVDYGLEPVSGPPVSLGAVRVKPFRLIKRNGAAP